MRACPPSQEDRDVATAYNAAQLELVRWSSAPLPDAVSPIVLSVVRNEIDFMGDFLGHYRALGVERFAIIDNGSSDGTFEYLRAQPDIDLYRSTQAFDWKQKQAWINRAVDYYGTGRWFVCADADERISYQGDDTFGLQDLIAVLEERGLTRARGFLLDMYSDLPVVLAGSAGVALRTTYPFYDAIGYSEERLPHIISRLGGVRARVFGSHDPEFKPQLTKYPLFRLDGGEIFSNPHHVWPYEPNFRSPCYLAILHYKFHGNWVERVNRAVAERNYWDGSREYRAYADLLAKRPKLTLWNEQSRRLVRTDQLVEDGLIEDIGWTGPGDDFSRSVRTHRANRLQQVAGSAVIMNLHHGLR